jgi:hypothetical protein
MAHDVGCCAPRFMYLFQIFRSFLPSLNPIGFGASDFIELALAAILAWLALSRWPWMVAAIQRLARSTGWCMLLLAVLPVALRLALLLNHPAPTPSGSDDFSYLLLADTLKHGRLANPSHPMHEFFEANFILQEPSYSSIYPVGQGIALALGWVVFGHPWAGVALSVGALCALCYWMLRAWVTPGWALAGGLLAIFQFGPLNQWMNSYWGGAVSAIAGCLVFGSLPRLRESGKTRYSVLLGLGLAVQLLSRPFEFVLLSGSALLFFVPAMRERVQWPRVAKAAAVVLLPLMPAVALTLLQNKAVTGSWTTLPYMLSRYQYGVPATFTFEPNPVPHRKLTPEQQLGYEAQSAIHGESTDTLATFVERLGFRIRFYRFFFLAPLYLAIPAFFFCLREFRFGWVCLTLLIFALGTNIYPYFYPHYIAAVTCLFVLVSMAGLERLSRLRIRALPAGYEAAQLILFLRTAHFVFWYGLHLLGNEKTLLAATQYETWDFINYGDPEGRISIGKQLEQHKGKQLVFVRYAPRHMFHEWIQNAADPDRARIVWAADLGPSENQRLIHYYPDRTVWLVEPDARPPQLGPYQPGGSAFESVP